MRCAISDGPLNGSGLCSRAVEPGHQTADDDDAVPVRLDDMEMFWRDFRGIALLCLKVS